MNNKSNQFSISLPNDIAAALRKKASETGIKISTIIAQSLRSNFQVK